MKIKIIQAYDYGSLEDQINEALECLIAKNTVLYDIKYTADRDCYLAIIEYSSREQLEQGSTDNG